MIFFKAITEVYLYTEVYKIQKPVTRLAFLLQPSNDGSFRLLCINDQQKWIVFEKQGIGIVGCKCRIGGLSQLN